MMPVNVPSNPYLMQPLSVRIQGSAPTGKSSFSGQSDGIGVGSGVEGGGGVGGGSMQL